jgi:hypothetical protein
MRRRVLVAVTASSRAAASPTFTRTLTLPAGTFDGEKKGILR